MSSRMKFSHRKSNKNPVFAINKLWDLCLQCPSVLMYPLAKSLSAQETHWSVLMVQMSVGLLPVIGVETSLGHKLSTSTLLYSLDKHLLNMSTNAFEAE